jgi:hypothetical protein
MFNSLHSSIYRALFSLRVVGPKDRQHHFSYSTTRTTLNLFLIQKLHCLQTCLFLKLSLVAGCCKRIMRQIKPFPSSNTKTLFPSLNISYHYYNAFLFLLLLFHHVEARISPKVYLIRQDPMKSIVTQPMDIYDFTVEPSQPPSTLPSQTALPTWSPSFRPTMSSMPTTQPSNYPSGLPSLEPSMGPSMDPSTEPSMEPSTEPSMEPSMFPQEEAVRQPSFVTPLPTASQSPYYPLVGNNFTYDFNYNPNDASFGPGQPSLQTYTYNDTISLVSNNSTGGTVVLNQTVTRIMNYTKYEGNGWESVRDSYESNYWKEFDMQRTLDNRCFSDPWRRQSPIDLCPTVVNSECFEHHQIRNRVSRMAALSCL